jgi:hypothetical protein
MLRMRVASLSRPTSITVRHSWLSERRCNNVTIMKCVDRCHIEVGQALVVG